MKLKTLKDFELKNKRVLLRTDINSDVEKGKVLISERIKEAAETIKFLKKKKARVVILAHQGNPGKDDFLDLKTHARFLNKFTAIKYISDVIGEKAIRAINNVKAGEAILLDNVRFVEDEFNPDKPENILVKTLAGLFDLYVNDAFSICHRKHTSITGFAKVMPSCAGLSLEKEIRALEKISIKECVYILGGAKPEENIKLLRGNKVLACGLFGQLCLVASGKYLGYQNEYLKKATLVKGDYDEFLGKVKGKLTNVVMPVDFAVDFNGKRKEFLLEEFPQPYEIEDIGDKTIENYTIMIKNAPAVYMKGPAGFAGNKKFAKGTFALLRAVASCKGFTLIGGGHLSDAIEASKINKKKFGHISLSGGALLNYVAGEKLAGLEVLGYYT